jgi:AraC family transcriptional regulator, regulatory protein of adaptative response / methylated-DNA-[protein]-cysteine methyltransferase
MTPKDSPDSCNYRRIEKAIAMMQAGYSEGMDSAHVAAALNISEFHFRRIFRDWAGVPPERFIRYLSKEHALKLIRESRPLLEASLEAGLSGPGRLVESSIAFEAMTPGEIRSRGKGLEIRWGTGCTPFGEALIALTGRGILELTFLGDSVREHLRPLEADFSRARFEQDQLSARDILERIFSPQADFRQPLLLRGTNFQIKVWEALLRIPAGGAVSYGDIAAAVGSPKAGRAVGSAVGANRIAYLIPCHRVIRAAGETGQYRWGIFRKQAMLARESAGAETGNL